MPKISFALPLLLLVGCGGDVRSNSAACNAYLACEKQLSTASGQTTTYDQAVAIYGPSGSCTSSSLKTACEQSCEEALGAITQQGGCGATSIGPTLDFATPVDFGSSTPVDFAQSSTFYDFATTKYDLGQSGIYDFAAAATLGCGQYIGCQENCYEINGSSTTETDAESCVSSSCTPAALPGVTNSSYTGTYDLAVACYQEYCLGSTTTPYKCAVDTSGTTFTEVGGAALVQGGVCETCLNDASAALYGATCTSATSTDCSTLSTGNAAKACGASFSTCLNN